MRACAAVICLSIVLMGCASPVTQPVLSPTPVTGIVVIPPASAQPAAAALPVSEPLPTAEPTQRPFALPVDVPPEVWESSGLAPETIVSVLLTEDYSSYGDIGMMRIDGTHIAQLTTYGYNRDPLL